MIFYWTYTPVFLDHTHITDKHTARGFRVKVINAGGCVEIFKKKLKKKIKKKKDIFTPHS